MSFTAVEHIDVWALASSLRSKTALFNETPTLVLREEGRYAPFVKDWGPLARTLKMARDMAADREWELGNVYACRLEPGETLGWLPISPEWGETVLPIVTNPLVFTFAGRVSQHIEAGVLTLVDGTWPGCTVNWGKTPHYHLAIECRPALQQKEAAE